MMQNTAYRLAEYKIIENEHGDLWWETHFGFGSFKGGKCFISGNILFIKPSKSKGPGFLKGEFLDHLNKLPKWEKTICYCASYRIYKCESVRKPPLGRVGIQLDNQTASTEYRSTRREVVKTGDESEKVVTREDTSYKLGRYEIIEKYDGQLFWKSHSGLGSPKGGKCHIMGNILFIGPRETETSGLMKRQFMQLLIRLPDWERTKYYCPSYAIYCSKTGAICRRLGENKDLKAKGNKNNVVGIKAFDSRRKIKPIIVNNVIKKDYLKAFFTFCILLVLLILKLLFGCFQMVYKFTRVVISKWVRFRG